MNKYYQHYERGSTLIWAMVIMLVMSLLATAVYRSSSMDRMMATNSVLQKMAYQGAESALQTTASRANLIDTIMNGTLNGDGNLSKTFPEQTVGNITIQGEVEYLGTKACSTIPRIAMSTELTIEAGGVTCQYFKIKGTGKVVGTSAQDLHEMGVIQFVPVRTEVETGE